MTDHTDPGANIVKAMQVVRSTHREVARMIAALDELLLARAWEPLAGQSWLDLAMTGAQLADPGNWLAGTLHRSYVPFAATDGKDAPRTAIVIYEIHLEPECEYERGSWFSAFRSRQCCWLAVPIRTRLRRGPTCWM